MPAVASSVARSAARAAAVVVGVCLTVTLAGCVDAAHTPTLTPSATPSPSATGTPTPTPTGDPGTTPVPLGISCAQLVDPNAVYDFNPNLALLDQWTPAAGTVAADAVAAGGVACRWVFESGNGTMDVSVARLSEERILQLKNEAFSSSQMVPTYGDEAYFDVEGGVGTAIVFEGRFWLVVSSAAFSEPGEPTGIIESALAALAALPPAP